MRRLLLVTCAMALATPAVAQFRRAPDPVPQTDERDAPQPPRYDDRDAPPPAIEQDNVPPQVREDIPPPLVRPGAGQDDGERALTQGAARLADPRTADAVASAVGAMAEAVMNVRIDGVRDAVRGMDGRGADSRSRDPYGYYNREREPRTLGEVIARDDPYFRQRLQDQARSAVTQAGGAARAAGRLEPELRRVAEDFGRAVEDAIARAGDAAR